MAEIPTVINLNQFLKVMGWGRTKFYEVIQNDANLRSIAFKEEYPRSKYTFYLKEVLGYKNRYRLGKKVSDTNL